MVRLILSGVCTSEGGGDFVCTEESIGGGWIVGGFVLARESRNAERDMPALVAMDCSSDFSWEETRITIEDVFSIGGNGR